MEQQNGGGGADEATVMAMLGDWREDMKEEPINLDELLQTTASSQQQARNMNSIQSQAASADSHQTSSHNLLMTGGNPPPIYNMGVPHKLPTFSSSANRPSVLDLSTSTVKNESQYSTEGMRMNMNGHSPVSPHQQRSASPHQVPSPHQAPSPHHSPYTSNQPVFNYSNVQQDHHSPVSPHTQPLHSPMSPHQRSVSPHSHHGGDHVTPPPLSPHMASGGQMSPHHQMAPGPPPLSPHSPYARSVSPHSQHNLVSPISPHHMSNHSGAGMSPHHPGMHSGAMSPHHMSAHSGSVSPVPRQLSPAPGASSVFGRYAGSPVSMHSGNSSDTDSYYGGYTAAQIADMRKRGINIDKDSHLYKAKRERNNVAVRKSREKKKQREQETEKRVKELNDENNVLQNKLDIAIKEMNLLKNLYKNIGVQLPAEARSKLETELSKFN